MYVTQKFFFKSSTTDIHSVSVRVIVDYSIDVQCHFIDGSDAQGCKIVITSDHPSVGNSSNILIKKNESDAIASAQLNLNYSIDCYHHVYAFDIEANGTVSSSAIIERIVQENAIILKSQCPINAGEGKFLKVQLATIDLDIHWLPEPGLKPKIFVNVVLNLSDRLKSGLDVV